MEKLEHSAEAAALTELIVEIFRVNGALLSSGDRMMAAAGQSSARWPVMAALGEEAATVPRVARNMGLTRQSVQRVVDLLVGEGLAEFRSNPAHRRSRRVSLTARGRSLLARIEGWQKTWSNDVVKGISERRIRNALGVLGALRARLKNSTP